MPERFKEANQPTMRKFLLLLIPLLATFSFKEESTIKDKAEEISRRYFAYNKNSGLAIAIISDEKEFQYCFGNSCQERIVDTNSVFEIGSITKVFTGLLLAKMVEEQKLSLNDNVFNYLAPADSNLKSKNITFLNLATHSSGLPRLADNFWPSVKDGSNPYASYSDEQLMEYISKPGFSRDPGTCYQYSNLGAGLLGYVMARQENSSYENLVMRNVCFPLGMNNTSIALNDFQKENLALGHSRNQVVSNWDFQDATAGQGALRSTISDMMRFMKANLQPGQSALANAILTAQNEYFSCQTTSMKTGLGWHIGTVSAEKYLEHTGGTGGYRSYIGLLPDSKTGVVILSNSDNEVGDLGLELLQHVKRLQLNDEI